MPAPNIFQSVDENIVHVPRDLGVDCAAGDLMWLDTDDAKPAHDKAWDTNIATTQLAFGPVFLGVAKEGRSTTHPADTDFPVLRKCVAEYDQASATIALGARVAPAKQTGDLLESQKLVVTTVQAAAIGYVLRVYGSATTRIKVRLHSNVLPEHNATTASILVDT